MADRSPRPTCTAPGRILPAPTCTSCTDSRAGSSPASRSRIVAALPLESHPEKQTETRGERFYEEGLTSVREAGFHALREFGSVGSGRACILAGRDYRSGGWGRLQGLLLRSADGPRRFRVGG